MPRETVGLMQPTFCFIDDADFELDNFQKNVAPAFKGIEFIYARDFDRALHKLNGRRCLVLFIWISTARVRGASVRRASRTSGEPGLGPGPGLCGGLAL